MPNIEEVLNALEICSSGGPCEDCYREAKWDCEWRLMEDAAEVIEEYLEGK